MNANDAVDLLKQAQVTFCQVTEVWQGRAYPIQDYRAWPWRGTDWTVDWKDDECDPGKFWGLDIHIERPPIHKDGLTFYLASAGGNHFLLVFSDANRVEEFDETGE